VAKKRVLILCPPNLVVAANQVNLPDHEHDMVGSTGGQYAAVKLDTALPTDFGAFLDAGPTAAGKFNYLPNSGGIKTTNPLSEAFSLMNPFLTINYIIRSGPPAF